MVIKCLKHIQAVAVTTLHNCLLLHVAMQTAIFYRALSLAVHISAVKNSGLAM